MSFNVALPIICDIRDEEQVKSAIDQTAAKFGGIDILVSGGVLGGGGL